jgi:hypothetical protein
MNELRRRCINKFIKLNALYVRDANVDVIVTAQSRHIA